MSTGEVADLHTAP